MSDEHVETAVREGTAGDGVSVKTETLPGSRVGLTIEVPSPQVDAAYQRVLNRLAQRVKVQGFRPGKAPRALIEAKVGAEGLREEVAESLIPTVVNQAVRDQGLDVIDRPQVEIQELERGKPATFVARVSVVPEVTLPDLDTLHVDPPHTEVDDAAVQRRLDALR
ncbi:MAG TPA: trigger factor family protein, partial [Candidatus Binatia bacterium]|nr:trigger factor family protein [Candidatus Binatia bacterium]